MLQTANLIIYVGGIVFSEGLNLSFLNKFFTRTDSECVTNKELK